VPDQAPRRAAQVTFGAGRVQRRSWRRPGDPAQMQVPVLIELFPFLLLQHFEHQLQFVGLFQCRVVLASNFRLL
jgi:hypothetical protein